MYLDTGAHLTLIYMCFQSQSDQVVVHRLRRGCEQTSKP